ncbi:hypothetical protein [Kineococcus sp. SYSU DK003]|uniref:hypothetical protein n=1 Tax=Kineococcus sp. SYSU DK003 TaxID=3383124 RepID=UPI003D7D3621
MSTERKANAGFEARFSDAGHLVSLVARVDALGTNWVVDPAYLREVGYDEADKSFGEVSLVADGRRCSSVEAPRTVDASDPLRQRVSLELAGLRLQTTYDLGADPQAVEFRVSVHNPGGSAVRLDHLAVWTPFAHVMFRDGDVRRNMDHSVAAFPSISPDFTKLALHRRSGTAPHLGLFATGGRTLSIGTWCAWTNRFFENASPSLDGVLFHQLVLAGGYPEGPEPVSDWIYPRNPVTLAAGERRVWSYRIAPFTDRADFAAQAHRLGHPVVHAEPLTVVGGTLRVTLDPPAGRSVQRVSLRHGDHRNLQEQDVTAHLTSRAGRSVLEVPVEAAGEHQVLITLDDGRLDQVVVNVTEPLEQVLAARTRHVADVLYTGPDGPVPHAFTPVSNQGESLGKLTLVLARNLAGDLDVEQVRKVERSVVHYVRPKWFTDGDLRRPARLYGQFYRVMDFEYIAHLLLLLSRFDDGTLTENPARTYLQWAADVFELRVNPDLHADERGKEESQMLGVYFLYVDELLADLHAAGLEERHRAIAGVWRDVVDRVAAQAPTYAGAVTEHFYDNAGFGPTAGALCTAGRLPEGLRYAELLEANIGYSNDFRAQAPDRWWEALSFMVHSLWGGLAAAAMLKVYEAHPDTRFLLAAYRATVAVLYCYDTAATTTALRLGPGEAASTYSVAGPHVNRPDLSRNRFGQSTFARDGGIFTRLFPDGSITPDWDMGEELVAYLDGFGRKTFLHTDADGEVRAVNGSVERTAEGYRVTSHAPYPLQFHFHERGIHLVLDEPTAVVDLVDGAFHPLAALRNRAH